AESSCPEHARAIVSRARRSDPELDRAVDASMTKLLLSPLLLVCAARLFGHPMGNFSVSHYTKLKLTPTGVDVVYALDLAEIPTFELLRTWNLERTAPRSELEKRASEQAREWLGNLVITADGKPLRARFKSAVLV